MNPISTKTTSSANHRRQDDALLLSAINWLCFLLAGMAMVAWIGAFPAHSIFFIGLEALIGWASLAALIHNIYFRCQPREQIAGAEEVPEPRPGFFASVGQWVLFAIGIAVLARSIYPAAPLASSLTPIPVSTLRLAGVVLLVDAVALYFLTNYTAILQKNALGGQLASLLRLCRIVYISCAAACIIIFTFLATTWDFSSTLGWFLVCFTLFLCLEPLLRLAVRFYLPKSQRRIPAPVGDSLVLNLLFASRSALSGLTTQFEGLLGLKVADLWIAQFLRQIAEPILLIGLLLGWLSTCVTAVPLDSRGVRVSFGRYSPEALAPGLHYSWPWPMGEIDLVQTERVQELSLGFDKDLAGPMLWTAPHFVGEQNLLVGDGESLLTVDVPIQYCVSDPVAFLQATTDAPGALKSLASRELIKVARSRESFQIMTVDRETMASELKANLQRQIDQMGLGLEIVFVGLKDVHPPVDVAPAYEKVVGAEEEKEATIDLAKAYQESVLPDATAAGHRLIAQAEADKNGRIDQATGDAAQFTSLVTAEREYPTLFRLRLRYDALTEGLPAPAKILVGLSGQDLPETYLDLRSTKDFAVPGTSAPHPAPPRVTRPEVPDE